MAKEIEVKFKVASFQAIRKKLRAAGARLVGQAFERTVRLDTPDNLLERTQRFLRVRTGFKNALTFKQKLPSARRTFKEREEIETEIDDPQQMMAILNRLGLTKQWVMEKRRQKWQLSKAEVVLDRLPFGNFVEIEGNPAAIVKTEKILGLNPFQRITLTYWDLWRQARRPENAKNEHILFENSAKPRRKRDGAPTRSRTWI